jgi:peptidoglycan/xylan/chitin deacetylase (PgdA/CDA1 family)/ketosteroid isomerase-like protein
MRAPHRSVADAVHRAAPAPPPALRPRAALGPRAAIAMRAAIAILGAALVGATSSAQAADASDAAPPRPILVSVDDLPVGGGSLHTDPADRARITDGLLGALRRHGIHAVAFVIWGHVATDADRAILARWIDAGHELGNHTRGHLDYTRTAVDAYLADVEAGRAGLQSLLDGRGARVRFFRFPYLDEGDTPDKLDAMRRYLASSRQTAVPVTIDDQDWSFDRPFVEARRAGDARRARQVGDDYLAALRLAVRHHEATGDALFGRRVPQILLLHANAVGAGEWDDLFSWLEATGHRFATADEVLADPAFGEPPRFVAPNGPGLWDRIAHQREEDQVRDALAALLEKQSAAWTRGDLDAFCAVYADDALFLSPSGLTRGRDAVLARYRSRYPDAAAMGSLRLDIDEVRPFWGIEVTPAGDAVPGRIHGATVAARWTLSYPDRPAASGRTLIVFRRGLDGWQIVQDASM